MLVLEIQLQCPGSIYLLFIGSTIGVLLRCIEFGGSVLYYTYFVGGAGVFPTWSIQFVPKSSMQDADSNARVLAPLENFYSSLLLPRHWIRGDGSRDDRVTSDFSHSSHEIIRLGSIHLLGEVSVCTLLWLHSQSFRSCFCSGILLLLPYRPGTWLQSSTLGGWFSLFVYRKQQGIRLELQIGN